MKHLSQITIIAAVSFLGELLHYFIPLPIPGSIYGLVIMFLLLLSGIVKVKHVKDVGDWLLTLMPIMFVAPIVGIMGSFTECSKFIIPIIITATVSTLIVMIVTGTVSQALISLRDKKDGDRDVK
ncbi:MAG: CidA/LrgA family protein [Clostridia bacterium]|nr:CidA/LrgA family protein [Clostridia bacterium]